MSACDEYLRWSEYRFLNGYTAFMTTRDKTVAIFSNRKKNFETLLKFWSKFIIVHCQARSENGSFYPEVR